MPRLDAIREIGLTALTYCRWSASKKKKSIQWTVSPPNKGGGMGADQLKELKRL